MTPEVSSLLRDFWGDLSRDRHERLDNLWNSLTCREMHLCAFVLCLDLNMKLEPGDGYLSLVLKT